MDLKDYVSLAFSGMAFALSVGATAISLRQKKYEIERTLRSQLTDAIGKVNAAFEAVEKLRFDNPDEWLTIPFMNLRSFYNGQKLFYARQAIYIAEQIPMLVTDVEYNSLARTFADLDDDVTAFRYYELAISTATTPIFKASSMRGYARLLIRNGQKDLGRQKFSEALDLTPDNTDSGNWFRAETLLRWAQVEAETVDESSTNLFDRAQKEFEKICFPPRRREGLANLQSSRDRATKQLGIRDE